jgi:hypothetical protein
MPPTECSESWPAGAPTRRRAREHVGADPARRGKARQGKENEMMDAALQITIETAKNRRGLTSGANRLLPLMGNIPLTVYVKIDANDTVGFSLTDDGPEFSEGMSWQCSGYALLITFVFTSSRIAELFPITPSFWFSDTFSRVDHEQQGCCVPSTPGTYHFNVEYTTSTGELARIDPKIVVTPFPG